MKVLSLTEPYATLIKEKKKFIETRSWKTDYRGELYIHASSTKIPKEYLDNKSLMELVDGVDLKFGNIICKCNLVDCIFMTKEYVEDMKNNHYQEYVCGVFEEGRYAFILEDITVLEKAIKARGQLNIWTYYNENEIMDLMSDISYGWVDKAGYKHSDVDSLFSDNYILQSPKEIIKSKVGVCWDQVELERYYFNVDVKTYFIVHYDGNKCPTHTFLIFSKDGKYYWFEHAWEKFRGIHEYNSINECLIDVRDKFIKFELDNNYNEENLYLYEYKKPKYNISVQDFYKHCENSKSIDVSRL